MKEIYIIRHGETEYNRLQRVQGSGIDAPLNQEGLMQAQHFYEYYRHIAWDKIYTSCLKRSIESVSAFRQQGIHVEQHNALNEINWGIYEGQNITVDHMHYFESLWSQWRNGSLHIPIQKGESPMQVAGRQQPFIDMILSRTEEKKILICMHGRAMRIFLCTLLGLPLSQMEDFSHHNLSLYQICYANGKMQLIKRDCRLHLSLPS